MNCFYLGYDNIFYQIGLNGEVHTKPVNIWPTSYPQQILNQNDWSDNFLKLDTNSKDLILVIPNKQYEDKKNFYYFFKNINTSHKEYNINIIPESSALAGYLNDMNYGDGKYRIINLGTKVVQIHDLEIRQEQHYCLNSQELSWDVLKNVHQCFKKKSDTFFTLKSAEDQKETLNQIYYEDFKTLSPKYHCYRVDYESTITYADIYEIIKVWKEDYNQLIGKVISANTDTTTLYCGELLDFGFFSDSINITDRNKVDLSSMMKPLRGHKISNLCMEYDLKLRLYDTEDNLFTVVEKGEVSDFNIFFNKDTTIKKVRIPVTDDNISKCTLNFSCNNIQYHGTIKINWLDSINKAFQSGNAHHRWVEAGLNIWIDDCGNIVTNIFHNSTLIHTESIAKLKKYEFKRIIS